MCCNTTLAYDILRYRFDKVTMQDKEFILGAFEEMLNCRANKDMCDSIVKVLSLEHERLVAGAADAATIRAVYIIQAPLMGASERNLVRDRYTCGGQLLPLVHPESQFERLSSFFVTATGTFPLRQLHPRADDVYVQFFLTKGSVL